MYMYNIGLSRELRYKIRVGREAAVSRGIPRSPASGGLQRRCIGYNIIPTYLPLVYTDLPLRALSFFFCLPFSRASEDISFS